MKKKNRIWLVGLIVFLVILYFTISYFGRTYLYETYNLPRGGMLSTVIKAYKIPSGAMIPTLLIGDRILVNRTLKARGSIKHGDLIVFKYPVDPKRDFIKRVIGVGGDTIESKDKVIYINGKANNEPYTQHVDSNIKPAEFDRRDNFGPIIVPKDHHFVMGDNRDQSYDSRFWGFVPKDYVRGKAFLIYWSWDSVKNTVRTDRIWKQLD